MAHVIIKCLVIYPPDPITEQPQEIRTLYTTADDISIPINLPLDLPITKPAIKAYLLSIIPTYAAIYYNKLAMLPIHNYDINQEFEITLPSPN